MEFDSSWIVILIIGGLILGFFIGLILYFIIESSKEEPSDGFLIFSLSILGSLGLIFLVYFIWKIKVKKGNFGFYKNSEVGSVPKQESRQPVPNGFSNIIEEKNFVTINHNFYPEKSE